MKSAPSIPKRCQLLLNSWRNNLSLTNYEKVKFAGEIKVLDQQLQRLNNKHIRIAVYGRVGVGKSSLLNALSKKNYFATDVAHGCTRYTKSVTWEESIVNLNKIELIDNPGIDEIGSEARSRLASRVALKADLILLVIDSDLNRVEIEAIEILINSGKTIMLVLNRIDQWNKVELKTLISSIKARLPLNAENLNLQIAAAAPRKAQLLKDGRVRSHPCLPEIASLRESLKELLCARGELLLALNALRQADTFFQSIKYGRFHRTKSNAQSLIGKFAALKASGVAANPVILFDLAGGLAFDTTLVIQLSRLYGLPMSGKAARELIKTISIYNAWLGGAQFGIQIALGAIKQLLIMATPITGGLSLTPAAPIALIQAAWAVHTTQITGKMAVKALSAGSQKEGDQPAAMLKRLASRDSEVRHLLSNWPKKRKATFNSTQTLLP